MCVSLRCGYEISPQWLYYTLLAIESVSFCTEKWKYENMKKRKKKVCWVWIAKDYWSIRCSFILFLDTNSISYTHAELIHVCILWALPTPQNHMAVGLGFETARKWEVALASIWIDPKVISLLPQSLTSSSTKEVDVLYWGYATVLRVQGSLLIHTWSKFDQFMCVISWNQIPNKLVTNDKWLCKTRIS